MAKKSLPKSKSVQATPAAPANDAPLIAERWLPWIPVVIGALVFSTGLTNEMLGIDDHTATVDNPAVRDFKLFGNFNLGMYAPLTWAAYGVAYALGKDSPFWYHLFSLAVHAFNIWLVFHLLRRLDFGQKTALAVTFLFAIHPIQVESVSWIAGFSTPFFSMFYLLACLKYLDFTEKPGQTGSYWLALLFFLAACLAKSAAVTLPITFILFDLWQKRPIFDTRRILGYAPFFLISIGFGLLTIYSREQSSVVMETPGSDFNPLERLLVLCYTPVLYWYKLLFPFKLNVYYSFDKVNGQFPWPYFAAPFVLAGAGFAAWKFKEKAPWFWFGLLFFFANISVMLPFTSQGTFEFCADHYNYLAMIGIALILVQGWGSLQKKWSFLTWIGLAWGLMITVLCVQQIRIWKDTRTVVTNAIDNGFYQNGLMYAARGKDFGSKGKIKEAIADFNKSLEINPSLYESYKYRGGLYGVTKQYDKSVADLSKYLEHYPDDAEQYFNRGLSLLNLGNTQGAIADFSKTLELNPDFARAYRARGNAYLNLGERAKGDADLKEWEKRQGGAGK